MPERDLRVEVRPYRSLPLTALLERPSETAARLHEVHLFPERVPTVLSKGNVRSLAALLGDLRVQTDAIDHTLAMRAASLPLWQRFYQRRDDFERTALSLIAERTENASAYKEVLTVLADRIQDPRRAKTLLTRVRAGTAESPPIAGQLIQTRRHELKSLELASVSLHAVLITLTYVVEFIRGTRHVERLTARRRRSLGSDPELLRIASGASSAEAEQFSGAVYRLLRRQDATHRGLRRLSSEYLAHSLATLELLGLLAGAAFPLARQAEDEDALVDLADVIRNVQVHHVLAAGIWARTQTAETAWFDRLKKDARNRTFSSGMPKPVQLFARENDLADGQLVSVTGRCKSVEIVDDPRKPKFSTMLTLASSGHPPVIVRAHMFSLINNGVRPGSLCRLAGWLRRSPAWASRAPGWTDGTYTLDLDRIAFTELAREHWSEYVVRMTSKDLLAFPDQANMSIVPPLGVWQ